MDTRRKIISSAEAGRLAQGGATVVSGYFDPLLEWHARRLAEVKTKSPLIVAIENPPRPILAASARAELAASLGVVDYVVESSAGIAPDIRLEREEEGKLAELIARVHARQHSAASSR